MALCTAPASGCVLSREGGGGAIKTLFWICMGSLLDYYSVCLSEWEKLFKVLFDVSVGLQNLDIMYQGQHNVSGSKVLTWDQILKLTF